MQPNSPTQEVNQDYLNQQDSENRERALQHKSFIVEAPAGAGKTELLTQRYLKLLATVNEPEEIIALTFTNKAAAEMRNRILLSLEAAQFAKAQLTSLQEDLRPHKLKTRELANAALQQSTLKNWDILTQPSRLRILTIDALCSSLTRQMPLLSKFGGQPVVSDDTETHYEKAAQRAIASIAQGSSDSDGIVTTALQYLDNNSEKLTQLLAKMLAMRDQWLPIAANLTTFDRHIFSEQAEAALTQLLEDKLKAASEILTPHVQKKLMPLVQYAANNLHETDAEAFAEIEPLLDWQTPLLAGVDYLAQWRVLASFLLVKNGKSYRKALNKNQGFPSGESSKQYKEDFSAIVDALDAPETIGQLLTLPEMESLEENQAVIQAFAQLLLLATTHLWAVFQSAGEVDFVAIAHSAQLALENEQGVTDLALKLDYKISHLLIDEFQDTSPVQMQLIKKLIEGWQPDDGRTLFCVGDPMQSIYRFRKADVSLFLQASQHGIGHLPLTRLQLSRNNRSHPAVVDWINHKFGQVFPAQDNINLGAIAYRAFTATRTVTDGEGVQLHALTLPSEESNEDADEDYLAEEEASIPQNIKQVEATYVAQLIHNLREKAKLKNSTPPCIAVLVRSRSHLKELVSEIRRSHSHLAFQAVEIEHLNDRQTVQDALSLTQALHHLYDRVHWLNVLRTPWCGLNLQDLHTLVAHNHKATVWQLMQDETQLAKLTDDGKLRLTHAKNILQAALNAKGRMPVRRWLESTWLQLGGAKCLVQAGDNRDVQAFFDLVEKVSHGGYLDFSALELGMQKLYAKPDLAADGSLQFLTIHKSKGLEFDTVILPALNRPPRHADNNLVLWQEVLVEGKACLLAAPVEAKQNKNSTKDKAPSIYQLLKKLEEERANNEAVRLLYVAATRTERQLHLIATIQANKKDELKPTAKSLLEVLWPAVEGEFLSAEPHIISESNASPTISLAKFSPKLQRLYIEDLQQLALQVNTSKPEVSAFLTKVTFNQAIDAKSSVTSAVKSLDINIDSGILAHLYMQLFADSLAKSNTQNWHAERLQKCLPAMQQWLLQQGHSEEAASAGANKVMTALQVTLASEHGQWVLQPHLQAASELSLLQMESENEIKNHVIDRTFIKDGVRWIIDYKLADVAKSDDLVQAAMQHHAQLKRYAALFLHEALPIKTAVLFLSIGQLVEVALI